MLIKTFNIEKSKRLWIVILTAVSLALILIILSFVSIYNKKQKGEGISNKGEILSLTSYYTEYNLTTFSNKNQNTYYIKEWYFNDNSDEKFRFDFENDSKEEISYMLSNNMLKITSNTQISSFNIENYGIDKKNLISISTFINIYNKTLSKDKYDIFKLESKTIDDKAHYIVKLDKTKLRDNLEDLKEYEYLLKDGLDISKLEVVVDNNKNIPEEYYVFNSSDEVVMGIKYTKFDIIDKFDEKIFANLNK